MRLELGAADRFDHSTAICSTKLLSLSAMSAPVQNGGESEVPLSPKAQEAKESMQRQLLRTMASKMYATAQEEERARRIKESQEQDDDLVKKKAFQDLMCVQEDLVRAVNVMKVSAPNWSPISDSLSSIIYLCIELSTNSLLISQCHQAC